MTTIKIRNAGKLSRTDFKDWWDLQDFLRINLVPNQEFELTDEIKAELDRREEDFHTGKEKGIPWEEVKAEIEARRKK